jgi:hypothetical protein
VTAPILLVTVEAEWLRLLWMSVVSTLAVVLAALFGPATAEARLVEFYRRVQPPGWWGRTAIAAGDDPRRPRRALAQALVAVVSAAISAYGLLIGFGMLLLQPDRWPTALGFLVAAVVVSPLWLRRLSGPADEQGPAGAHAATAVVDDD